jgi:Uma2 family endonuclease
VVVEVLSKSTRRVDSSIKLAGYFRVPSVVHYLLLWPESRTVVHHRRGEEGRIESAILRSGTLTLDPPGISLAVEALFPPAA